MSDVKVGDEVMHRAWKWIGIITWIPKVLKRVSTIKVVWEGYWYEVDVPIWAIMPAPEPEEELDWGE